MMATERHCFSEECSLLISVLPLRYKYQIKRNRIHAVNTAKSFLRTQQRTGWFERKSSKTYKEDMVRFAR